jgi:antitoxin component of RelBE/YafQ-DinJ toxin-antitoxin module
MTNKPVLIRMDKETRRKADEQAAKLGLNLSEYVRLIINIDAATDIIKKMREGD